MKIQIELTELQILQIDDLQRRTGLTVENIFTLLKNKLETSANSRGFLCEAISAAHRQKILEDSEIRKLKTALNYK